MFADLSSWRHYKQRIFWCAHNKSYWTCKQHISSLNAPDFAKRHYKPVFWNSQGVTIQQCPFTNALSWPLTCFTFLDNTNMAPNWGRAFRQKLVKYCICGPKIAAASMCDIIWLTSPADTIRVALRLVQTWCECQCIFDVFQFAGHDYAHIEWVRLFAHL